MFPIFRKKRGILPLRLSRHSLWRRRIVAAQFTPTAMQLLEKYYLSSMGTEHSQKMVSSRWMQSVDAVGGCSRWMQCDARSTANQGDGEGVNFRFSTEPASEDLPRDCAQCATVGDIFYCPKFCKTFKYPQSYFTVVRFP